MRKKMSKKAIAIALVATVVLGGAGAAFAYWTSDGSGTGTVTAGTSTSVTVAQDASVTAARILPGVPLTLSGTITNPGTSEITVDHVTAALTSVNGVTTSTTTACDLDDFTVTTTEMEPAAGGVLAAGATGGAFSGATITLINLPAVNQNYCKDATFIVTYSAVGMPTT
ncbi:hypothetical protein E3T55_13655 [Cryobacterium frigoriphilum]|uniref:Alternate-type signal peptide domain-containing protein n=1 Tax=Cryobacterium frigoriphilum TaxID=1259150 RepID=A0A4R8ZXH3_9MICO|nr:hypothetical protein [Cryobacterium frigoriphilum]TFD48318.1 hypothetical protein E3T55_13655 [Cryobacterium frigoriphilum]